MMAEIDQLHLDPDALADADLARTRQISDVGHYFDQTVFDLQYTLLRAQARRLALEADLAAQGIRIDPHTGVVSLSAPIAR